MMPEDTDMRDLRTLEAALFASREPMNVEKMQSFVPHLDGVAVNAMLARLRQRLRRQVEHALPVGQVPKSGHEPGHVKVTPRRAANTAGRLGVTCVFSREEIQRPDAGCSVEGSLNCAGYGSSVMVTATFGMVAAEQALSWVRCRAV